MMTIPRGGARKGGGSNNKNENRKAGNVLILFCNRGADKSVPVMETMNKILLVASSSYCKRHPCQSNHNCRIRGLHRSTDYYRPDDLIVVLSVDFISVVRYPRSKCP